MRPFLIAMLLITARAEASYQVVLEKGKNVLIVADDGRVAELKFDRGPILVTGSTFGLEENTCVAGILPNCRYRSSLRAERYALFWKTHPDATKIGRLVRLQYVDENVAALDIFFRTSIDRYSGYPGAQDLPEDEISCDQYQWLPGGSSTPPKSVVIKRWDCEAMYLNPETGLLENRIFGGATDVLLKPTASGAMKIEKIGSPTGPAPALFFGDIRIALITENQPLLPNEPFCQLSLRPDYSPVLLEILSYVEKLPSQYNPYVWGSDAYSKSTEKSLLQTWLNNPKAAELF